eukprot:gene6352-10358_t
MNFKLKIKALSMIHKFISSSGIHPELLTEQPIPQGKEIIDLNITKKANYLTEIFFKTKAQDKINIVIPTTKRTKVNFNYLVYTLTNLTKSFQESNIDFEINTFSTTKEIPFKMKHWNHFQFKKGELPSGIFPIIHSKRDSRIQKQSLEWLAMMKIWKKKCPKDDIFLYMEDDFIICPQATVHLYSLYHMMKKRKDLTAVKFSFGLNGIIMRCNDLSKLMEYATNNCFVNREPPFPVDWAVGDFYSYFSKNNDHRRISYSYRYNLFKHIGKVSSVLNDDDERSEANCFGSMYHQAIFMQEKFDVWSCPNKMFSPCGIKNKVKIEEYSYRNKHDVRIDYPFSSEFRQEILNQLEVKDYVGNDSCEDICMIKMMKCSESGFPLINNCEWMKKKFGDCECEFTENPMAPCYYNKKCYIKRNQPFYCDVSNNSILRICPCQ